MARSCPKCGDRVPANAWIDGKKRNLGNRKYCLECSPFGSHNTAQLERIPDRLDQTCIDCGKKYERSGRRCSMCYFRRRKSKVTKRIDGIVGTACWTCGYSKTRHNLCFHHVNPKTKLFGLTTRETMLKWERVLSEMKKCVLVCHNCHGEIHCGLISENKVRRMWKSKWA